jgi:hypothetical protein
MGVTGPQEVVEYARFLGIDPLREPHLLSIAQEGLVAPLPDGWTEHEDDSGNVYYHQVSPPPWHARIHCTNRRASADADVFRPAE